ncbi:MAG: bifunctional DNA-formamidopyrimidine glycosylase/DNA-(apurinic or apyrimidinic site) lyase [Pyrinomonadaceae bacterium]
MPELPEVELISRSLHTIVKGSTIASAELLRRGLAPDISPEDFAEHLGAATINFVHRRGKHILIDLTGGKTLIVHLRMSGRFSLLQAEAENPKFTHALFHLTSGERLVFDDLRHFGLMKVVETEGLHEAKELKKLAPEPFSPEFSIEYLSKAVKGSKRSLKEFLLDQTKVCGLGNIYAAEAMFAAGLDPTKSTDKLSKASIARLHESIIAVLNEAVSHAGTREVDPENLEGSYFSGLDDAGWFVYDREGEPCKNCETPILRLKQGGRSTYYCHKCQRR